MGPARRTAAALSFRTPKPAYVKRRPTALPTIVSELSNDARHAQRSEGATLSYANARPALVPSQLRVPPGSSV